MRYRDLKDERDAAVARAVEAERLSMKSEFDRVTKEFEEEKARLVAQVSEGVKAAYRRGFVDGRAAFAKFVRAALPTDQEMLDMDQQTDESKGT